MVCRVYEMIKIDEAFISDKEFFTYDRNCVVIYAMLTFEILSHLCKKTVAIINRQIYQLKVLCIRWFHSDFRYLRRLTLDAGRGVISGSAGRAFENRHFKQLAHVERIAFCNRIMWYFCLISMIIMLWINVIAIQYNNFVMAYVGSIIIGFGSYFLSHIPKDLEFCDVFLIEYFKCIEIAMLLIEEVASTKKILIHFIVLLWTEFQQIRKLFLFRTWSVFGQFSLGFFKNSSPIIHMLSLEFSYCLCCISCSKIYHIVFGRYPFPIVSLCCFGNFSYSMSNKWLEISWIFVQPTDNRLRLRPKENFIDSYFQFVYKCCTQSAGQYCCLLLESGNR